MKVARYSRPAASAVLRVVSMGALAERGRVAVVMSVPFVASGRGLRRGGRGGGRVGGDRPERDEGDADVADLLEQAVQRGLVDDGTAEHGGSALLHSQAHAV